MDPCPRPERDFPTPVVHNKKVADPFATSRITFRSQAHSAHEKAASRSIWWR
jgi:hypothetical protein